MKKWLKVIIPIVLIMALVVVGIKIINKSSDKNVIKVASKENIKKSDIPTIAAAYIPLWKEWKADEIKGDKLTNLYLAFGAIDENFNLKVQTSNGEEELKEKIKNLKNKCPNLKISIAIGGNGVDGFSDMSLLKERREVFCESLVSFIESYNLDGVDIDWEFPVQGGWGTIKARKEDKENFTLLMKDIKDNLDTLEKKNKKKYYLSFASTTSNWGIEIINIKDVEPYIDSMNLMAYDYTGGLNKSTGHNSNLYKTENNNGVMGTDAAVAMYIKAGLPSNKIVLGIPAYGSGWTNVKNVNNGLFQPAERFVTAEEYELTYKSIKNNYVNQKGFKRFWDDKAKAPYLFDGKTFITYDDKESIVAKAQYVKAKALGGMMIWEYLQDDGGELTEDMYDELTKE